MTQDAVNSQDPFVQIVSTQTGTLQTLTTLTPADDTIPQNTEGAEVLTVTITPKFSTSRLEIVFISTIAVKDLTTPQSIITALFQDTTADALAATCVRANTNGSINCYLHHVMTSGTTSATTFKIRVGPDTNTLYINGTNVGAQTYGGVSATRLVVKEYI